MKTLAVKKKVAARTVAAGLLLVFPSENTFMESKVIFIEFDTLLVEPRAVFCIYGSSSSVAHEL